MAPVCGSSLGGGAFRAVRVADFVLREGVLASATFVEFAVTARQALNISCVRSVVRGCIGCDFTRALLIGFGAVLVASFLVMRFSVGNTCNGKERGCEHDVFHGVCFHLGCQSRIFFGGNRLFYGVGDENAGLWLRQNNRLTARLRFRR